MTDTTPEQWSDDPITTVAGDRFNRSRFANLVAASIDSTPLQSDSAVFGLVGSWGSGKSSVANMVGEQLPGTWRVQNFTPWAASGTAALQAEFLTALDTALGGASAEERGAREALKGYVKWVAPALNLLPVVGETAQQYTNQIADAITARKPWAVEFEAMSAQLKDIDARVLIICDDIDRLDAIELLEFLKVVRLLGRFPNVHYLVVYDGETVEDLLATQGVAGRASSFMEKIVQHPFELPAIDAATHFKLAADALNAVEHGTFTDEEFSRAGTVVDILSRGLRTPRQHLRYGQHLKTYFQLVTPEVDFLDFAALSFLRLNHHEIFDAIPRLAVGLRVGLYDEKYNKDGRTQAQWKDELRELDRRGDVDVAWEILTYLFPRLGTSGRLATHPRAFSSSEYRERYYNLGVPSNDVSDQLVADVIEAIVGGGDPHPDESQLLAHFDGPNNMARLAFSKGRRFRERGGHAATATGLARMVRILNQSASVVRPAGGLESPHGEIDQWLVSEVQNAYAEGGLSRDELMEIIEHDRMLGILLSINRRQRSIKSEHGTMLADFAQHYREKITSGQLEPLGHLRLTLSLLARVDNLDSIDGILDPFVNGNQKLFEDVTISFVRDQTIWGSDGDNSIELEFENYLWSAAISESVRLNMVLNLEEIEDADRLDDENPSDENRRKIAFANARAAMVKPEPAGNQPASDVQSLAVDEGTSR